MSIVYTGNQVRGISLDLWHTILTRGDVSASTAWRLAECVMVLDTLGYSRPVARVKSAIAQMADHVSRMQEVEGLSLDSRSQVRMILAELDVESSTAELAFDVIHSHAALSAHPQSVLGVYSTLEYLCKYLPVTLISNTGATSGNVIRQILKYLKLNQYFTSMFFSDEVGVSKPNPLIFELAANSLGISCLEMVHIGDSWVTDIEGSLRAGVTPIWISTIPSNKTDGILTIESIADLPQVLTGEIHKG